MKNIRLARYPAGTSHFDHGHLIQKELEILFNQYVIGVDTSTKEANHLRLIVHPHSENNARSILTNWMQTLTIDHTTKQSIFEKFQEAGHNVPLEQIASVSIAIDDVLYENLVPITNIPEEHVIHFSFDKKVKNSCDYQYLNLMRHVRDSDRYKDDRTNTGTVSEFGYQMRFDLNEGLPLLTTKKTHLKSIIHELIWFLAGDTNIKYLKDNDVSIWDEWADANGELGPVYGAQWRAWHDAKVLHPVRHAKEIEDYQKQGYLITGNAKRTLLNDDYLLLEKFHDQITNALNLLKNNPDSRRIIVSAWNVPELPNMKLAPCHCLFQFYANDLALEERIILCNLELNVAAMTHEWLDKQGVPRKRLSCQLYQRSADIFLGVPFNIASYAILTYMFAQQLNMTVGDFVWTGGDVHLYSNHKEQVEKQLARTWREMPKLVINRKPDSLFDYKFEDFELVGYDPHPGIKAPVAV